MMLTARARALSVFAQAALAPAATTSRLQLVVRPWDVDLNVHLTNSRFPQLMDLGRLDLLVRSGAARALFQARQNPILVELRLRFVRELRLGTRYVLETRATQLERRAVVFTQRFLVGDTEHAVGTAKVVLVANGRVVTPTVLHERLQVQESAARLDQ